MKNLTNVNWVMLLGGLTLAASFFMPWMSAGPDKIMNGMDVAAQTQSTGGSLAILYALPVLGLLIAGASLRSRKISAGLGIAAGVGMVGFGIYEVFRFLSTSTFYGMWLTLIAALLLLVGGAISGHWRNPPDEVEEGDDAAKSVGDATLDAPLGQVRALEAVDEVAEVVDAPESDPVVVVE